MIFIKKKQNKKKRDIEAKLFILFYELKEEKNKTYSPEECEKNVVYIFDDHDSFKSYFEINGFVDISEDLLELCRMKTTKKGTVIALKGLCDHAIRRHSLLSLENTETVSCDRTFVVSKEKSFDFKNAKPNYELRNENSKFFEKVNNINNDIRMETTTQEKVMLKTKK